MRVYVGERSDDQPKVWVVHREHGPRHDEIESLKDELGQILYDRRRSGEPVRAGGQGLFDVRKRNLIDQIELVKHPPETFELPQLSDTSPELRDWSLPYGGAMVARAILGHELGEDPPAAIYLKLGIDIVAPLPRDLFQLPASHVWAWIEANRRLVETELFERPPPAAAPVAIEPTVRYVGDATDDIPRVWVVHDAMCGERPEVVDVLDAAEGLPAPEALEHPTRHAGHGFAWGTPGRPATDLAIAILQRHTGTTPPLVAAQAFVDDVISRLPPREFELSAIRVAQWIADHPRLLDTQWTRPRPGTDDHPSLAIVHDPGGAGGAGGPTASSLVGAMEAAWSAIQTNHPEVPDAVIVLGSGIERGRLVKLGHWWGGRWLADGQVRGEVLLAGEALHLKPTEVFEILLHEAAHGLNAARGVKDSSRGGRYHNQHYRDAAAQLGLRVQAAPPYGWARTSLTPAATERYSDHITALGESMRIARQLARGVRIGEDHGTEVSTGAGLEAGLDREADWQPRTRNGVAASCGCGRRIRMAPTVLAQGPVLCGLCGHEFTTAAERATGAQPDTTASVLDTSFVERRHRALALETTSEAPMREGTLRAWREAWGTERELLLVGANPAEVEQLNGLAREALKATGAIHGPTVHIGGREFMTGDRVVVGAGGLEWPGNGEPIQEGIPGIIEAVDPDGAWVEIDFAIEGQTRFPTHTLGSLNHGYAVDENDIIADLDLHPIGLEPAQDTTPEPGFGPEVELP